MTAPLYRRILGTEFDRLPPHVRELHDLTTTAVWAGRADVERGQSWLARIAATIASLPPSGPDQPLRVTFEPVDGTEIWLRQFGTAVFRSVQYERDGTLRERVGPSTLVFTPLASAEGLALRLDGFRVLGVPLPRVLHPSIRTFESEREGRYQFEVEATSPRFGLLVRYAGWLENVAGRASA